MIIARWLTAVFLTFSAAPACAQMYGDIEPLCRSDRDTCILWFSALAQGLSVVYYYADTNDYPRPFCLPESGATGQAMAHVIIQYVDAHPEQWHLPLALLGFLAFKQAFPCP